MTTEEAVRMFLRDIPLINRIANGGPTDVVETDDGPVRSVAKLIADKDAEISAAFADFSAAVTGVGADRALAEVAASGAAASLAAALAAGKVFDNANQAATSTTPVIAVGDTAWIRPNPTDGLKRLTATKRIDSGTTIASFAKDQNFGTGDEVDGLTRNLVAVSKSTDVDRFGNSTVLAGYYNRDSGAFIAGGTTWVSIKVDYNQKREYRYTGVGNASSVASVVALNAAGEKLATLISSASETGKLIDPATVPVGTVSLGVSATAAFAHSLFERAFQVDPSALGPIPAQIDSNAADMTSISKTTTVDHQLASGAVDGFYFNLSGAQITSTNWRTTGPIDYDRKKRYFYTGVGNPSFVASVSAWNAAGWVGLVHTNLAQETDFEITPAMVPAGTTILRNSSSKLSPRAFKEVSRSIESQALGTLPADVSTMLSTDAPYDYATDPGVVVGYIDLDGALITSSANWRTTPPVPVTAGATIVLTAFGVPGTASTVSMWDAANVFLGWLYRANGQQTNIPISPALAPWNPACVSLRASAPTNGANVFHFIVTRKKIDETLLPSLPGMKKDIADLKAAAPTDTRHLIPPEAYALQGRTLYLTLGQMVGDQSLDVSCNLPESNVLAAPVTPPLTSTADIPVTIKVMGRSGPAVTLASFPIHVTQSPPVSPAVPLNIWHFGDSTVDGRASSGIPGAVVNEWSRQLTGNGTNILPPGPASLGLSNIYFRGTLGTGPVKHEGRSGWDVQDYLTQASKITEGAPLPNAFWNVATSAFDFNYYLSQNAFDAASTPSGVLPDGSNMLMAIQCIWNDAYDTSPVEAAGRMGQLIDLIKAQKPLAKFYVVSVPPPPRLNFKSFTGTRFVSPGQIYQLIVEITAAYRAMCAARTNCYFLSLAHQFNPETAYPVAAKPIGSRDAATVMMTTDHVHPLANGYAKIADALVLKSLYDCCRGI